MKILAADDRPVFRRLIEAALQKAGHEVVLAQDGKQAWEALAQGEFDLAVLDWMMPEMDGVTLCRKLRRRIGARYLYLILLTAKDQLEDVVQGLDAGADEYLVKPFNPEELRARVRAGGRIVALERRLSQANARLEALASTDELTGLPNRREILRRLEVETARSQHECRRVSIVIMDLDEFKEINDEHGHASGDAVLREASARLTALLRPYHSLGRMGGDELLLVAPGASEPEARALGERMRAALADSPFLVEINAALRVTGAFGAAELDPIAGPSDALARADRALYEAKRRGGNCVTVASALLTGAMEEQA